MPDEHIETGYGTRREMQLEIERLREALTEVPEQQQRTLRMIERNGFVFETPLGKPDDERTDAKRWEKLAFSIYTDLCQVAAGAEAALSADTQREDG